MSGQSGIQSRETSGLSGKQNCFPRELTLSVLYLRNADRVVNRHNKYQGTQAVHRTTNLLLTVAACGLVYGR